MRSQNLDLCFNILSSFISMTAKRKTRQDEPGHWTRICCIVDLPWSSSWLPSTVTSAWCQWSQPAVGETSRGSSWPVSWCAPRAVSASPSAREAHSQPSAGPSSAASCCRAMNRPHCAPTSSTNIAINLAPKKRWRLLIENPYRASLAIQNHTVLAATRHRWKHPTLTPAREASTQFTYPRGMEGWVDLGVGYVPKWFTCLPIVSHPPE